MEKNEKIVAIATAAIVTGSAAVFAIAKFRNRNKNESTQEIVNELAESITPAN